MLVQLIITLITFFQLFSSHVRCSIHRIVTCCSNKVIMHKCKNMTSEIYVPHEFHVAHTQQPEQLSALMCSSSEKWKQKKNQPVTFRKTISVRRLSRVRSGLMFCREERKQSVVKPVFLLLTDATDASFLPPSVRFINFPHFRIEMYTWSITHWRLYGIH